MTLKTKEELSKLSYIAEGSYYCGFTQGKLVLTKAKRLVKNNYIISDFNGNIYDLNYIQNKVDYCYKGHRVIRGYNNIYEYVDRKNKVYYVDFGYCKSESFMC